MNFQKKKKEDSWVVVESLPKHIDGGKATATIVGLEWPTTVTGLHWPMAVMGL
jgi:hypothetical protein